jgi:hypothetical protein
MHNVIFSSKFVIPHHNLNTRDEDPREATTGSSKKGKFFEIKKGV